MCEIDPVQPASCIRQILCWTDCLLHESYPTQILYSVDLCTDPLLNTVSPFRHPAAAGSLPRRTRPRQTKTLLAAQPPEVTPATKSACLRPAWHCDRRHPSPQTLRCCHPLRPPQSGPASAHALRGASQAGACGALTTPSSPAQRRNTDRQSRQQLPLEIIPVTTATLSGRHGHMQGDSSGRLDLCLRSTPPLLPAPLLSAWPACQTGLPMAPGTDPTCQLMAGWCAGPVPAIAPGPGPAEPPCLVPEALVLRRSEGSESGSMEDVQTPLERLQRGWGSTESFMSTRTAMGHLQLCPPWQQVRSRARVLLGRLLGFTQISGRPNVLQGRLGQCCFGCLTIRND